MAHNAQYTDVPQHPGGAYGGYPQDHAPLMGNQAPPGGSVFSSAIQEVKAMPNTVNRAEGFLFAAALSVVAASLIGSSVFLFGGGFQFIRWIETTYITIFGLVLCIVDTPILKSMGFVARVKILLQKYVNLLSRLVGKGLTYIFLGSSLLSTSLAKFDSVLLLILMVLLCLVPIAAGALLIVKGVGTMRKLETFRKFLFQECAQGNQESIMSQKFHQYARNGTALTAKEFLDWCNLVSSTLIQGEDMFHIYNALVTTPTWQGSVDKEPSLSYEDFRDWVVSGKWVIL